MSLLSFTVRQLKRLIYSCCLHLFTSPSLLNHSNLASTPITSLKLILQRSPKHFSVHILLGSLSSIWKLTALSLKHSAPLAFLTPHLMVISLTPGHSFHLSSVCFSFSTGPFNVAAPWDFCSSAAENCRSDRVHKSVADTHQQKLFLICVSWSKISASSC